MTNLFTYGSLMCADIMGHVSGQAPRHFSAIIKDYFCSQMKNETYPGMYPAPGESVKGVVYIDLSKEAILRLDNFEGEYYERRKLTVYCEELGSISAYGYVIKPQYRTLLTGTAWSYDEFLRTGKEKFEKDYFGYGEI